MTVSRAEADATVRRCWPVMRLLRPHLDEDSFVEQVERQRKDDGYHLVFIEDESAVRAVAGYRLGTMLWRGRFLYVDDLVTDESHRSRGHGRTLFEWLVAEARRLGCDQLCLESGVQRFDAHRFYFRQRMHVSAYHFTLRLDEQDDAPTPAASSTT